MEAAEVEPRLEITEPPIIKTQKTIRVLYWLIPPIILATIILAWWQYPETFSFQKSFISQLGTYTSQSGFDNSISSTIMTIGFGLCAVLTLTIATTYFFKMSLESSFIKGLLNCLLALGAAGIAIPFDHPTLQILHLIGALVFVIGFGVTNFVLQLLRFIRKHRVVPERRKIDFYIDLLMVILVFIALGLFVVYDILNEGFNIPTSYLTAELTQKIVLIVDGLAIYFLDIDDM